MIPWIELDVAQIPNNGGELKLAQRGDEFSIRLSGVRGELMNSRVHGSEEALAEIGCRHLAGKADAHVLVGGLGMGFTLAAALRAVAASAQVTVAELIPAVVAWNRGALGACAGQPLSDPRTRVYTGDVAALLTGAELSGAELSGANATFDAVLLDVDNGPEGLTKIDNSQLYSPAGLQNIHQSLRAGGTLAVWSSSPDTRFVSALKKAGFAVTVHTVRARPGKGSRHTIFLAQKK